MDKRTSEEDVLMTIHMKKLAFKGHIMRRTDNIRTKRRRKKKPE